MEELERFVMTDDHIILLRHMYVDWDDCETGAPAIDPKRPYGNSDVPRDIYDMLDGGAWDDDHYMPAHLTPTEWEEKRMDYIELHRETKTALQIVLATGSFEPGVYVKEKYFTRNWRKEDE